MKASLNLIAYYRDRCKPPLTQASLAELLGVHPNSVQRWETHGVSTPHRLDRLTRLFIERQAIQIQSAGYSFWRRSGRQEFPIPPELDRLIASLPEALTSEHSHRPPAPSADTRAAPLMAQAVLPHPLTTLIGRDHDIARLSTQIRNHRLVTIRGPGGCGKTSLAIACAHAQVAQFQGQVIFLELEHLTDHRMLIDVISNQFGITQVGGKISIVRLAETLRHHPVLLVLDNMEHLLDAAPDLATLLQSTERMHLLATSRIRLNIEGEREYPLSPLRLPDLRHAITPDTLADVPAVALFIERARDVNPEFVLTADNARSIAEICLRLDGLPLAIELAAARMRIFTPDQLLDRLIGAAGASPLDELTSASRVLPKRRRTLRTALDWSYNLLSPIERRLFARLAIFAGSWTAAAAEAVCTPLDPLNPAARVASALETLRDNSLLRRIEADTQHEARFQMLQVVHEYALEHLRREPDYARIAEQYTAHYVDYLEQLQAAGLSDTQKIAVLEREYGNLRTVLGWLIDRRQVLPALRMCSMLYVLWDARGMLNEGGRWIERMLMLVPPEMEQNIWFLTNRMMLYLHEQGEHQRALVLSQQLLARQRAVGHSLTEANILGIMGFLALLRGDYTGGAEYHRAALSIYQYFDLPGLQPFMSALTIEPLPPEQVMSIEQSRETQIAIHTQMYTIHWSAASILLLEGLLAIYRQDFSHAIGMLERSLQKYIQLAWQWPIAINQVYLGIARVQIGQYASAEDLFRKAMLTLSERQAIRELLHCIEGLCVTALHAGNSKRAVRLCGAVAGLQARLHIPALPLSEQFFKPHLSEAQQQLGEARFMEHFAAGQRLTLDQALDEALRT